MSFIVMFDSSGDSFSIDISSSSGVMLYPFYCCSHCYVYWCHSIHLLILSSLILPLSLGELLLSSSVLPYSFYKFSFILPSSSGELPLLSFILPYSLFLFKLPSRHTPAAFSVGTPVMSGSCVS